MLSTAVSSEVVRGEPWFLGGITKLAAAQKPMRLYASHLTKIQGMPAVDNVDASGLQVPIAGQSMDVKRMRDERPPLSVILT